MLTRGPTGRSVTGLAVVVAMTGVKALVYWMSTEEIQRQVPLCLVRRMSEVKQGEKAENSEN